MRGFVERRGAILRGLREGGGARSQWRGWRRYRYGRAERGRRDRSRKEARSIAGDFVVSEWSFAAACGERVLVAWQYVLAGVALDGPANVVVRFTVAWWVLFLGNFYGILWLIALTAGVGIV